MSFLGALADQISSQFSLGENDTHSLDAVIDGQKQKYGSLGDYAQKFDQSAERRYVEEGYLRRDPYNTDAKRFEILVQEPNATVFVKKRMFSSIAENFRPDFMNNDEMLYYKASKVLFANKCRQISALEKLSKIQKITSAVGGVDNQLIPVLITLADTINAGSAGFTSGTGAFGSSGVNGDPSNFNKVIDRLRKIYGLNSASAYTSWVTDTSNIFNISHGHGTGVIELTNFSSINTSISVDIKNPGTFNFNIIDPYQYMVITEFDIEKAIADASNSFYNHQSFQFGLQSANETIAHAEAQFNQARNARGASPITFKVNADTLLSKRVTAIIDRVGIELLFTYDSSGGSGFPGLGGIAGDTVKVSDEYLKDGAVAGFNGLDTVRNTKLGFENNIKKLFPESELSIFKRLVTAIFNKISLEANSKNAFQTTNKDTNYARKKMRFAFSGQTIIQPMDTVHIYMNSKSRFDSKLMTGVSTMFSGAGILSNANNAIVNLQNSFNALFNPSQNIPLQAEKSIFVGADFPNSLWTLMRNQFVTEKEGTHVFAGVVENVQDDFKPAKFEVSVSGRDNTAYFDQGKINFKPGADTFNGSFFDPLTPFKTKFDSVSTEKSTELLNENVSLLGATQDDSFIKFKLGRFAGEKACEGNILMNGSFDETTGQNFKTFYAPDGLVYKWKEGIGVFTQFGSTQAINSASKTGNPNLFAEPFAGLDVMNVLSLLVTGVPYNFATYFRVTQNVNGYSKDSQTAQSSAHSYFGSLSGDLSKKNVLWGNFIPFKSLVVDEQTYVKAITAQSRLIAQNNELEDSLQKLSGLNGQAILSGLAENFASNKGSSDPILDNIEAAKAVLQEKIDADIKAIQEQDANFHNQFGVDSSFDVGEFVDSDKQNGAVSNPSARKYLRQKINFLTRRMSYDVRANEDKNFFIVDDTYDKDYDLMAYNQALTEGIKIYNNDFTGIRDKIALTASLLNLEVFCDTQGHVRVRPAQYNRMPSSVFYRMMYLKHSLGIQIFPQFMEDFFGSQIDTLRTRLEIIEDQIRFDAAVLGTLLGYDDVSLDSDNYALRILSSNNTLAGQGAPFQFVSSSNGEITDIGKVIKQVKITPADQVSLTDFKSTIGGQANSNKIAFSGSQKVAAIREVLEAQKLDTEGVSTNAALLQSSVINDLTKRIERKSGQKITPQDYIITNTGIRDVDLSTRQTVDVFKIAKELGERVQERQAAMKLFYNTVKNVTEFKALDNNSSTASDLLLPGNFGNSHIPEVFEHMIEDETYDDYGVGSGNRFVIRRSQIRSLTIGTNAPPYTAVEVQGTQNTFAPNAVAPGLGGSFPGGGNAVTTALAVDYDMWRNFGFKESAVVKVPFLSDPVSQCGPYASMLLSIARKNILKGTLVISGNEFMQPGEVIFLEDRGMLFYVNSVKHSVTMGSSFTTTLELTYGHTPGEYIPTVLDIIGKMIYKNRDSAQIIVQRQERAADESNMGVIQRYKSNPTLRNLGLGTLSSAHKSTTTHENLEDPNFVTEEASFDKPASAEAQAKLFQASDISVINNVLSSAAYVIHSNGTAGQATKSKIELRLYYESSKGTVDPDLLDLAGLVKEILTNGREDIANLFNSKGSKTLSLPSKNGDGTETVEIVQVDLDSHDDLSSPSQKAINAARNNINNIADTELTMSVTSATPGIPAITAVPKNTKVKKALFAYVIDVWIKFEQVPDNKINGGL